MANSKAPVADMRNIMIVEDEPLIAMMLEDYILELGHGVCGPYETVDEALAALDRDNFELAILDVHLKGASVWPVAHALKERGIPFVLASGGHVEAPPAEFADTPMIEKPYTIDRVTPVIEEAFGNA